MEKKKKIFIAVGGIALVGGLIWYFQKNNSQVSETAALPSVSPTLATQGGQLNPQTSAHLKTATLNNTGVVPPKILEQIAPQFQAVVTPVVRQQITTPVTTSPIVRQAIVSPLRTSISSTSALRGVFI